MLSKMQEEIYKNLSLEDLPGEVWKDVADFEGIYRISNMGRLASNKCGTWKVLSEVNKKGGYLSVILSYKGNRKYTRIHRLVYEAFIGNIQSGKRTHIHHKDGNKQNNCIENLELIDSSEHSKIHRNNNPNILRGMIKYNKYVKTKKIVQKDMNGYIISIYNNGKEASDATGVCQRNILQVASKTPFNDKGSVRKQAGGFIWEYLE